MEDQAVRRHLELQLSGTVTAAIVETSPISLQASRDRTHFRRNSGLLGRIRRCRISRWLGLRLIARRQCLILRGRLVADIIGRLLIDDVGRHAGLIPTLIVTGSEQQQGHGEKQAHS